MNIINLEGADSRGWTWTGVGVRVEVEALAKGGQTENERGPICGKIRIRKCDLRKCNIDNH